MKYTKLYSVLFILFMALVSCETETEEPRPTFTLTTTASPAEGGTITLSPPSGPYNEGQTVTLTPAPNTNWVFQQWEGDASGSASPLTLTMNANKSVTGVFVKRDYPLNITTEGEGTVNEVIVTNPSGRDYPHGTTVELTPVPGEGWVFDSWGGDLNGNEVPQRITVEGEKNVSVVFKIAETDGVFYLADNGITCKCELANPGEKGMINGVEYEAVNNALLRQRRDERVDMTRLCTSLVTNMYALFVARDFNQSIGNWDVSNVTNMGAVFADSPFNQPIGDWNVSKVTFMAEMFASSQFNQPIGGWDVSNVTEMDGMFVLTPFNQPIGDWNVGKVTLMNGMFAGTPFNQPIGDWDVGNVTNMGVMFAGSQFNQPIGDWDVSKVVQGDDDITGMRLMFYENQNFNQDLSTWCVENIPTRPEDFRTGATAWVLPEPVWGTCPD